MDRTAIVPIITAFEKRYRGDHTREHGLLLDRDGQVVTQNSGNFDSVNFDEKDLNEARGGIVTHTHPRGLPPSGADLALAATYDITLRAVGNAPDTGQQFDHTVRFTDGNVDVARLQRDYDDEIERAEQELSKRPFGDLQWQRESRHLALQRLSSAYGFIYIRTQRNTPVSEATRHERARLDTLASVRPTLASDVWMPLASDIARLLVKSSQGGVVPIARLTYIRSRVSALVQKTMLGVPSRDGALEPYTVQRGQVIPRSVYFLTLYRLTRQAASVAVQHHAEIMRKHLPADLMQAFSYATLLPSEVSEADEPQFDPLHLWLGPDGKRLSDRIWNATGDMRRKLDDYLTGAIARQLPVEQMAAELEAFLVDGPGAYEALRLTRTEVAAAASRAGYLAARRNPFVEKYQPFVSPEHSCSDECDIQEANGPYDLDDPSHLPPFHPNCADGVRYILVQNTKAVVNRLRQQIADAVAAARTAITDILNPLSRGFVDWLFRGRS